MSDIGGIGNVGGDPFVSSLQRQQEGSDLLAQQQRAQEQAVLQGREIGATTGDGNSSLREQKRDDILENSGSGIRREEAAREGDSPRLRQLSDETAEIDTAFVQPSPQNISTPGVQPNSEPDEVNISEEAQQRLSQETAAPVAGETLRPEPEDPLTVDTPRERQEAELSDQVDRGNNETQAGRALGQVLDQFS
ncbi:MAG: hypothetical protein H8D70_02460 [Rhodospirillaceae bacterium]|nr:hypothetical protein [Rhodospirillaceae bacterium]